MSSKPIHPLTKINPTSECWRICVRVIRLYTLPAFNDNKTVNSIEMVFIDEQGTTIHATVRRSLVTTFEKVINEGSTYVFAYFGVGNNSGSYRTSRHEFRLNFQPRTTVTPCSSEKIAQYGIKLVAFPDIFQADSTYPYLVDTMGMLAAVGNEKEIVKESKRTKMIVITLDAEGMKLDVTLFGEYVKIFKSFFDNQALEHAVIVLQYAKIKVFQGRVILQNVMFGTRLLLNPDIDEVTMFRQRMLGMAAPRQPIRLSCDDVSNSEQKEFLDPTRSRVIATLKNCNEDGSYILYGTILAVTNDSDWWYLACKCNRAVRPDGAMYYCMHCSCRVFNVTPRYLIKLTVGDDSGTATFVLFDREASSILNASCAVLMERNDVDGNLNSPKEFDDFLLGKTYLFKVEVRTMFRGNHDQSFRVSKICHDSTTITKYLEKGHAIDKKLIAKNIGPIYSAEDEFLRHTRATTIEALKDCTEDGDYAVYGTIKGVDGGSDWFIAACRCGSELIPRSGSYYCTDCKKRVLNVIPRYRIKLRVNDASDSATFVVFENIGCLMLQKSCSEMLKFCEDVPGGSVQPDAFKHMLEDKSFVFKVEVRTTQFNEFDPAYNVIDDCFNEEIIAKFKDLNSAFFSPQTDIAPGFSTGDKGKTHCFLDGESSSCVKDLIADFVETVDTSNLTPIKRMQENEAANGYDNESVNKMRSVKVEKI